MFPPSAADAGWYEVRIGDAVFKRILMESG
jgi:hypothetical protein